MVRCCVPHTHLTRGRRSLQIPTKLRTPSAGTKSNLGNVLCTLGEQTGRTERLEEAVCAHRAALEEYTREHMPFEWARTQNNLGDALQALGKRESGTERLEQAEEAYRAALEELTRERMPLGWIVAQASLNAVLTVLCRRRSGVERVE